MEGETRYDKTPDDIMQDIIEGVGGSKDVVANAINSIESWSAWFIGLINIIKDFFAGLKIGG